LTVRVEAPATILQTTGASDTTMSRYSDTGGGNGNGTGNNYDEDAELKLQDYACIRGDGKRVNAFNGNWGDKFIAGFDNVEVLDGIVFQRKDKPMTVKVFSVDEFGDLDPETGLVHHEDTGDQLSAEEMLEMPEVLGFSEKFGDTKYKYNVVGVVLEAAEDIALNGDLFGDDADGPFTAEDLETATDEGVIPVGRVSMLLPNQSWTRTLAKKLTARGDGIISDNGADDPDENPKYADSGWLTTLDPELREGLEGRTMELWVTEETREYDDGEQSYTTPNLKDVKTDNWVTIDNGPSAGADDGDGGESAAATDGGSTTQAESASQSDTSPETTESPDTAGDDKSDALPADVPDVLDDLIDYFARTQGEATADELEEFAADEVEDPDAVDWDAAAAEVGQRA